MRIAWDIDGVLRNLYPVVRRKFGLWSPTEYYEWDEAGYNIYDLVKKDYSILEKAKPSKYILEIQNYLKYNSSLIEVWSYQPEDWIEHTNNWLKKYFKGFTTWWLKPEEKFKNLQKDKDVILVEDNPHLPVHDRIWLIDHKYNRRVKCKTRIKTVEELRNKLEEIKNGI